MPSGSRKKFRIRSKPKKPDLRDYTNKRQERVILEAYDGYDAGELKLKLDNLPENASIELELDYGHCWYESDTPSVRLVAFWTGANEAEYHMDMAKYGKKLADYETWYAANQEAIEEELVLRAEEAKQKELKKAERLERKAAALRKKNG